MKLPLLRRRLRAEQRHQQQHRWHGGRRQRVLPSAGRSRSGQLRHRWTTDQRPAEQGLFDADSRERDPEPGAHHRCTRRGVRRQIEPGGERDHQIGPRRAAFRQPRRLLGIVRNYGEKAHVRLGTAKFGNFIALNGVRTGHFLDTPEISADPRHREQRKHFRSRRLPAGRPRRPPSGSVRGAQLVPGAQQLRSVEPGPEAARADVECRARLSAHVRLDDAADRESLRLAATR